MENKLDLNEDELKDPHMTEKETQILVENLEEEIKEKSKTVQNNNTNNISINVGDPGEKQVKSSLLENHIIDNYTSLFATNHVFETSKKELHDVTSCTAIIYGNEGSGKKITAINVAEVIRQHPDTNYTEVRFLEIGERAGIEALRDYFEGSLPKDCIFISRSSADKTILGFLKVYQDNLLKILAQERCYLIVCTNEKKEKLSQLNGFKIGTENNDLEGIFEKHIIKADMFSSDEWSDNNKNLVAKSWESLSQYLTKPIYIKIFCQNALESKIDLDKNKVIDIAIEVVQTNEEPSQKWFIKLSLNEKIYAMQAILFESLTEERQDRLHIGIIELITNENIKNLHNPRSLGINEIKKRLKLRTNENKRLEFINNIYRHETEKQIENYRFLLLKLMDEMKNLVLKQYLTDNMRYEMGSAIGRIGRFNHGDFERTLDSLIMAGDDDSIYTAGFALSEMAKKNQEDLTFIIEKTKNWLNLYKSNKYGHKGYKAACLTFFYIFEVINDKCAIDHHQELLKCMLTIIENSNHVDINSIIEDIQITQKYGYYKQDTVMIAIINQLRERNIFSRYATYSILKNSPNFIKDHLKINKNKTLTEVYYSAFAQAICSIIYSVQREPIEERSYIPYFQYIFHAGEVGVSIENFMMLITSWLKWPRWKEIIKEKMLEMVLRGSEPLLWQIVDNISKHWLLSSNSEAEDIGNLILKKAWLMLGFPVLNHETSMAIYIDTKNKSLRNKKIGLMLWNILKNYTTLELYEIGVHKKLADNHSGSYSLTQSINKASIIMPSIETQHSPMTLHVVFSDDPIIDLDDAFNLTDNVIYFGDLDPMHHPWLKLKIKPIRSTNPLEYSIQNFHDVDELSRLNYAKNKLLTQDEILNIALIAHQVDNYLFARNISKTLATCEPNLNQLLDLEDRTPDSILNNLEKIMIVFQSYLSDSDIHQATTIILKIGKIYPNIGKALSILLYKTLRTKNPTEVDHQTLSTTCAHMTSLGWSVALHQQLTWRFWLEQNPDWCKGIMSQRNRHACPHWNSVTTEVATLYRDHSKDIEQIWRECQDHDHMTHALKLIKHRFQWLFKITGHHHSIELTTDYVIFVVDTDILKTTYADDAASYIKQLMDFTWRLNKDINCILFPLGNTTHKKYFSYSDHEQTNDKLIIKFLNEVSRPSPKIVGPIINLCDLKSLKYAIFLTKSKIIDLSDFFKTSWMGQILYFSFNSSLSTSYVEDIKTLHFDIERDRGKLKSLILEGDLP